MFVLIHVMIS